MSEKLSTHVGFIKVISPWLPDSTGREGLRSWRTDIRWSSALVYPTCFSESSWREFGHMSAGSKVQRIELKLLCACPFISDIHRGFGVKERGEIA